MAMELGKIAVDDFNKSVCHANMAQMWNPNEDYLSCGADASANACGARKRPQPPLPRKREKGKRRIAQPEIRRVGFSPPKSLRNTAVG
jgi:hypothetical protein